VSANAAFDAVACCGAIVIVAVPATIPLLRRMHAVDVPSVRSSHSVPTPRGGGLPIAVGLLAAVAITRSGASAAFAAAVGFFAVLAAYLCSPALFRYLGLYGKPEPYRPGSPAQPGQQSHSALPGGPS
jgi:UDP-N-acetylmuramyl pentapeptide phosphotransferase/UDP-N-acetylglucosamine-1-phosphate transferase